MSAFNRAGNIESYSTWKKFFRDLVDTDGFAEWMFENYEEEYNEFVADYEN